MKELFSELAVERGFLTSDQAALVVDFHNIEGRRRHPAEVGVDLGLLTPEQASELKGEIQHSKATIKADIQHKQKQERQQRRKLPTPHAPKPSSDPARSDKHMAASLALSQLVKKAIDARASDLHIHARTNPFIRVDGQLREVANRPIEEAMFAEELKDMLSEEQWTVLQNRGEVDLCSGFRNGYRLRLNVFREKKGLCATFRIIPPDIPTLAQLKIPRVVATLTDVPQGLVLITGPARCGKTTTLAALVKRINDNRREHVVTIERPIEFVHQPMQSSITQRSVGLHTKSYASALRAALREDPDVIVIGELNDKETVQVALTAAETGHLVLGTLHTRSVESTIARVLDAFGDHEEQMRGMLADSLRGVLVQQLIPSTQGGLVPAVELLFHNGGIGNCIRKRKLHQLQSLMQSGRNQSMITWNDSLRDLLSRNLISRKVAEKLSDEGRTL